MQITYYEEGERNSRSMFLIIGIHQGVNETRRVVNKDDFHLSEINVFKHNDDPNTTVVFPMSATRSTAFGNILYDLTKSEARGYRSD